MTTAKHKVPRCSHSVKRQGDVTSYPFDGAGGVRILILWCARCGALGDKRGDGKTEWSKPRVFPYQFELDIVREEVAEARSDLERIRGLAESLEHICAVHLRKARKTRP